MKLAYPYHLDARGRTAEAPDAAHVRGLIEQVLFTAAGERVMRPDFGSGVRQLLFAPNSDTLAAVVQMTVQAALTQWLGQVIVVDEVAAEARDETLTLTVRYALRLTGETRVEVFSR
jgi:phage baseplate assembly protein W